VANAMAESAVQVQRAPCGCVSALFHLSTCKLVHGDAVTRATPTDRIFCDAEDGCVWLHVGDNVAPMTPKAAREFGDQMHVCAQAAEKPR
jgi:hypothetical protein